MRAWLSWSSGKDATFALQAIRAVGDVEVTGLLTSVNASADRVAMHAVRRELLQAQARALGLPLHVVDLPSPCTNEVYEQRMAAAHEAAQDAQVEAMVFGDLCLEDVRAYRERTLSGTGIEPIFPLWGRSTTQLANDMVGSGLQAVITCVDPNQAPRELAGRWYDEQLLGDLPDGVDPCGENGEFHTFVADGPGFTHPVDVCVGDSVERDGFVFTDVLPAGPPGDPV